MNIVVRLQQKIYCFKSPSNHEHRVHLVCGIAIIVDKKVRI